MHSSISFFFNDTATTEIYTLSLHDALPIYEELARSGLHAGRLARHLQQRLAVPRHDGWQFGLEDGHLDASRLAQLVSDPQQRAIFRNELPHPVSDAAVALLLDCSGSDRKSVV